MKPVWLVLLLVLTSCAGGMWTVDHPTRTDVEVTTIRLHYSNTHLVRVGERFVVVDPGYERNVSEVIRRFRELGVDRLDAIIVTHGHSDHAGAARVLSDAMGGTVYAGRGDEALIRTGRNDRLCPTNRRARRRLRSSQDDRFEPFEPDVWVDAEQTLNGLPIRIVPMPGHTPGSLIVLLDDVALVGDLIRGSVLGHRAERHFYMCDLADNTTDISDLLDDNPRLSMFFTGHFGPVDRSAVEALRDELRD